MALMPPVSAMKGTIGPPRTASARWIELAVSLEPVKATPATRVSRTSAAPTLAAAGQQLQHVGRHAGLVQQLRGEEGDDRRLLGRLGEHRIAGGQRRRHLAGEDRQREVPRD